MRRKVSILLAISLFLFVSCQKKDNNTETITETTITTSTTSTESSFVTQTTETVPVETTTASISETSAETTGFEDKPEIIIEEKEIETQVPAASETESSVEGPIISEYFVMPDTDVRPVAVMIDNEGYNSYPQGGIEKAQIVYEMVAEYGETRLMPVFFGLGTGNIGPVRSIRHYLIQFAMEYDPVLVHIGFSPQAQSMIDRYSLASVNGLYGEHAIFFDITKDANNWQDSYTKLEYIKSHLNNIDFRKSANKEFPFEYTDEEAGGDDAENIYLGYSSGYDVRYEYDEATGLYARIRKGAYHLERYTGNILAAKNIIIQVVNTYPIPNDTCGRMSMDNVGSGTGYFVTEGKYREITWEKTGEFDQTSYRFTDTAEKIKLKKGQTWIMIMPEYSEIIIE
jgi:hypothetical protein